MAADIAQFNKLFKDLVMKLYLFDSLMSWFVRLTHLPCLQEVRIIIYRLSCAVQRKKLTASL